MTLTGAHAAEAAAAAAMDASSSSSNFKVKKNLDPSFSKIYCSQTNKDRIMRLASLEA